MKTDLTLFDRFGGHYNYEADNFDVTEWYYVQPLRKNKKTIGLEVRIHSSVQELLLQNTSEEIPDIFQITQESEKWWLYSLDFCQSGNWNQYSEGLHIVFNAARDLKIEPAGSLPQLFVVDHFFWFPGYHGNGFSAHASAQVRAWIAQINEKQAKTIKKAMQDAYLCYPWKFTSSEKSAISANFNMWVHNDRFGLSTQGDCACLGVDGCNFEEEQKYPHVLNPHNVDHVSQRFSLLSGIAELWFLVRQSLISKRDLTHCP
jgi:hypothetical protein